MILVLTTVCTVPSLQSFANPYLSVSYEFYRHTFCCLQKKWKT
jgi:hypothetical protein